MSTPPQTIYMQWRDDELGATWTEAPVYDEDVKYIRADVAQAQLDAANKRNTEYVARQIVYLEIEIKAANARIAELEAAQRWVSVNERLPEVGDTVATISRSGSWGTIPHVRNGGTWFYHVFSHWMLLPPPPVAQLEREC